MRIKAKDYEIIKDMRWSMNVCQMKLKDWISNYNGDVGRERIEKLWAEANRLRDEKPWKQFLQQRAIESLNEFSNSLNDLLEDGIAEPEIANMINGEVKFVNWALMIE